MKNSVHRNFVLIPGLFMVSKVGQVGYAPSGGADSFPSWPIFVVGVVAVFVLYYFFISYRKSQQRTAELLKENRKLIRRL